MIKYHFKHTRGGRGVEEGGEEKEEARWTASGRFSEDSNHSLSTWSKISFKTCLASTDGMAGINPKFLNFYINFAK